ncbi:hypothetical protein [Nocardioides sp.]|uniref:hypothetical protein n=1 Tax=Nocardioides sp. TaxID=35761 RepID=UPI00273266C1|nr:hypothetical protein [Nocardioides sp.]MDP3889850.1 hypothetical protein [Nocardioides sp.]
MSKQQITLVYAGRRLSSKGKIIHEWHLDDRELYFDKVKGTAIGGRYEVQADMEGDGVTLYGGTLSYAGEKISDTDQIALWQAEDQHARTIATQQAAERRHGKSTELDAALAPLLQLVTQARTQAEVRAIARVVDDRITQAWWRR